MFPCYLPKCLIKLCSFKISVSMFPLYIYPALLCLDFSAFTSKPVSLLASSSVIMIFSDILSNVDGIHCFPV